MIDALARTKLYDDTLLFVQAVRRDDERASATNSHAGDAAIPAFNDAAHKVEATIQEKMSGMTAGLGLPPGFKLPF